MTDAADERAVDDDLRGIFREQDSGADLNTFERIFENALREAVVRAEQKNNRTHQRPAFWNLAYGMLAVAVLVVLLEPWNAFEESLEEPAAKFALLPDDAEAQSRQLVAELSRSSRWIAPSDSWLNTQHSEVGSGIGELPDFSGMKFTMQETLQWPDIET